MEKRNSLYTLLAVVMVVLMAIVMPAKTYAAEDDDDPGVYVDKQITVQEDGTYILDLEAYATGTVTTTTVIKPCDLVLVLDASSSMGMTSSGYLMEDGTVRIQALVDAVNSFLATVAEKNAENAAAGSALSRVAIVVFSDSDNTGTLYDFTEITRENLISNSVYATYTTGGGWWGGSSTTETYTTEGYGTAGRKFELHNYTWTDKGLSQANTLLSNLTSQDYDMQARNRVVVMFTDGYPNHDGGVDDFDVAAARAVVANARTIKSSHQATLFSIAVLGSNAKPELNPQTTNQSTYGSQNVQRVNQMLHAASSNYPQASVASTWNMSWGSGGDYKAGYYKSANTADSLKDIFKTIAESSASTETPLTSESVMKDIISSSFTLPDGADASTITVSIVPWDSTSHTWSTTTKYTPDQWKTACTTDYGAEAEENVTIAISEDNKTIDVTGFDYGTHFLATSDPTQDINEINKNSAKVVVTFPIQAKPSAITGSEVATNGENSGIYIDGTATEPLVKFPQPTVTYTPVTYVVDYVTSDTSHDTKASTVKLEYDTILKNVQMLDDPSDDYLIGEEAVDFEYKIYKGKYGTVSFGNDVVDAQRRYVRYAPTTMNWNGYDRIFVKGESASDSDLDVWAMLCVLPANSVFYEDTYITQTKKVEYNNQTVAIEYTGIAYDEGKWDTVGTEGKNKTQHVGDEMGWVSGLADDSSYANDMAHKSDTVKAKAVFTFSGTGVDIYSRTNGGTGTVSVRLQGTNPATGKKFSKSQVIDTKAAAGDFFAIPICTFTDLAYGEYTVTIMVTGGAQSESRLTFYLDGIRVYNPIQPLENEENVQEMYGEKNLGAVYTEVRSMLLSDPSSAQAQAVYIDEHYKDGIVPSAAAIESAASDLADAQAARDKYVDDYITPAKNNISDEEYKLQSANDALASATNIYNAAVAALNNDPGNEELQAAVEAARTTMNEKQAALEEAQNDYDAIIGDLNAALESAIAGRADFDEEVERARKAYADASGGVIELAKNDATIEQYKTEGPKHEVLLDKSQSVAISVESGKTYYIGLRSLNGNEVTAMIGSKVVKLSHSVDLYYEAEPVDDVIVIKNTSENGSILSVTKLRTTAAGNTKNGVKDAPTEDMLNVVRNLAKKSVSDYNGDILTVEEAAIEEAANTEQATFVEVPETTIDENDIVIDNPESDSENEIPEETVTQTEANSISSWYKLLSSFSKFYRR